MKRVVLPWWCRALTTALVVIIYGIVAACAGPPIGTTSPYPSAATEAVTVSPEQMATTSVTVKLELWLSVSAGSESYVQQIVGEFQASNPGIEISLVFVPYATFLDKLATAAAAGALPDATAISYNFIAELQTMGVLVPLQDVAQFPWQDFLPDALDNVDIQGVYYALPWQRYVCTPGYLNLALFTQDAQRMDASVRLFEYLTSSDLQERSYKDAGWYPTLTRVYENLGISCPTAEILRPPPETVSEIIDLTEEDARLIQQQFGLELNPSDATADLDAENNPIVRAAAALSSPSEEEAKKLLESGGLAVGGLFVDEEINFAANPKPGFYAVSWILQQTYLIAAGDYMVSCTLNAQGGLCTLTALDGTTFTVVPEIAEYTQAPASQPVCSLEVGSKKFCWTIDGVRFCITIG